MRYRWIILATILLLGISGLKGLTGHALADNVDHSWVSKVISIQGKVVVNRHGQNEWVRLRLNAPLFPGDRIRIEANSRAGLVLKNDAVLRLDQNTTLVFAAIEQQRTFLFNLLKGAVNFFSRRPRSLKVATPFVNGVVEGTEFYVQVDDRQTRIDLFDGRVLAQNAFGELQLVKGQGAIAEAGSPPQRRILVRPRDSVQWAIYYPPVLSLWPDDVPEELRDSLAKFKQNRTDDDNAELEWVPDKRADTRVLIYRAGLLLHVGRVHDARKVIQQVLSVDADNGNAMALQSVIAVAQNRKAEALAIANMRSSKTHHQRWL